MSFLDLRPSDAPALIEATSGEVTSYRDLVALAGEVGAVLGEKKRLVFVLSRNDRFTCLSFAGAQLGGHAVGLLDAGKPLAEHAPVLAAYAPDHVAGPPGTTESLVAAGFAIDDVAAVAGGEVVSLAGQGAAMLHPDLALLLGTSGTTGSRKYVRLSRASIEANARSIAMYLDLTPRERPITVLPLHYSFGLSVLDSHWLAGAAVVLSTESVIQRSFWTTVEQHGCTSLAGVPYTYQMLERVGYRAMGLPEIRTMQQAGGALDRVLTERYAAHMAAKGGRFFVMYGQTEATARIAYIPPDRLPEKLGSAGMAIPGGQIRVEDDEVIYEGPNVMLGYAEGRDDLSAGDELDGVLRTGDIGRLDSEGFLYLTGRSKRIAKVFGLRINLDEVELLLREPGPAAVVAGDDVIWGFCAYGTPESLAEERVSLAHRLRLHPKALELRHVAEVPVSSSGKIDYTEVERWTRA